MQEGLRIMRDHYPDCVGTTYIVNAPFIFKAMWVIAKGWVDERKRNEIKIYGENYLEALLEEIDEDQIPVFLGGTNDLKFPGEKGPWLDYEVINTPIDGKVGVRRKDQPNGPIFSP